MSIVGAFKFKNLLYYFQKTMQSNAEFYDNFITLVKLIEEYRGAGLRNYFPKMIKKEFENIKVYVAIVRWLLAPLTR
jgi:hypothetical protein